MFFKGGDVKKLLVDNFLTLRFRKLVMDFEYDDMKLFIWDDMT